MEIGINTPVDEKSDRDPDSNFFPFECFPSKCSDKIFKF